MDSSRFSFVILVSVLLFSPLNAINIPGNFTVIGLFKIHEPTDGRCGSEINVESVMIAEAVKWYIQQLNQRAGLPFTIGFEAYETCQVTGKASEVAVDILKRVMNNESIVGVIGPEYSSETEVVSYMLGSVTEDRRLPLVGFSATAIDLVNKEKYPSFFRVIPNDNVQVDMMIKSMIQLQWNRIAVIYENDVYGMSTKDAFTAQAKLVDICVSFSKSIDVQDGYSPEDVKNIINEIIEGNANRPYINGILYIGYSRAANTMFHHLTNTHYSTVPIVMLSEGVGLDLDTFTDFNDRVYSKAKGTLISSPPQIKVTEFSEHWKQLFESQSVFQIESESNPWLDKVFQAKCTSFPCRIGLTDQSVFIYYAITAAHALVKSTKELHGNGLLNNDFKQKYISDHLKGLGINFNTDFSWRPGSIAGYRTYFDSNGEVLKPTGNQSTWELYNLRSSISTTSNVIFTKIGEKRGDAVDINFSEIRDYDGNDEVSWPNVRKAQCTAPRQCLECYSREQLHEDIIFEPGDLYVVGIVPVYDNKGVEECGVMRKEDSYQIFESIRLPILKMNTKTGDYRNFFPGVKIGLIVINSCLSTAVTQRKIYNLHKNGVKMNNGTVVDLHGKILGFIGEYFSSTSMAIADVLTILNYVQISYASTSPALSDRTKYPYFMRVVTPDDAQARAMVEIMKKLDVNYAQIIYSSGAYGEGGRDKVKELAKQNGICIINDLEIAEDGNPAALFEKLRKNSHAKVVVAFLYPHDVQSHIKELTNQMEKGEFIFIGSEAWARNPAALQVDTNHILQGSFTVSLEIYRDKELRNHIQNIQPVPYRENPWAQIYVQTKYDCYFNLSFDKSYSRLCTNEIMSSSTVLDTYDTPAYIAAQSLLIGANNFLKQSCGAGVKSICSYYTPEGLVEEILKVKLDLEGGGNPMKVFDSKGDGNIGYRVYNIQRDPDNPQTLIYVEVGRFPLEGTFTFEKSKIQHATSDGLMSKCPNQQTCATCIQDDEVENIVGDKVTDCPDNKLPIILGSLFGVVTLVAVVLLVLLCCRIRSEPKTTDRMEGFASYISPERCNPRQKHYTRQEATESKIYLEIGAPQDERYSVPPSSSCR